MKTLIVDDDSSILDVLTQIVGLSGHQVIACASAEDAWQALQTDEFPLIILDWMLPGITGLELCRRIRTLPWGAQSHILIVTARLEQTALRQALAAGADDYLAKPFDLDMLQLRLSIADRYVQSLAVRRQTEHALRESNDQYAGVLSALQRALAEQETNAAALRASEERFRHIVNYAPIGMALVATDGRFLQVNAALCTITGYTEHELMVTSVIALTHPDDLNLTRAFGRQLLAGTGSVVEMETRYLHKQGQVVWVQLNASLMQTDEGQPLYFMAQIQDITQRKQAVEALRESEQHFRALLENAPVGACIIDHHNVFVTVNAAYCALFGYTREELVGHSMALVYPQLQQAAIPQQAIARAHAQGRTQGEYVLVANGGRPVTVLATMTPITGLDGQAQWAFFVVDITAQAQREQNLARLAHYDALTGLPNRVCFLDSLRREVSRAQRHGHLLALLYVDLDGFKAVNDTRGHQVGDQLLHEVAQRLRAGVRQSDMPARLGGDEFTILLPDVDSPADAGAVAEKILATFAAGVRVGGADLPISASIGISVYPDVGQEGEDLLASADAAMYRAKVQGKNRYAFSAGEALSPDTVPHHKNLSTSAEPSS